MDYMNKLFYNLNGETDRKNELSKRFNSVSTKKINLEIKPMNHQRIFYLYYIPTEKTMRLIAEVYKIDCELKSQSEKIPGLAKKDFLGELITSELFSTNEIEGVDSTREEIARTTKYIIKNNRKNKERFDSVIYSYFSLANGSISIPESLEDVRKIYDEVTGDEIADDDLPDGELFRSGHSLVVGRKVEQEIHRGVYGEENIKEKLTLLIEFMNEKNSCNLLNIAIAHYYFGYIHPFYDGNGRTGRFISSIYLNRELSSLSAMSLSQGINLNKGKYYKAFDKTNQISSQGELNYFVDVFLELLIDGQKHLKEELESKLMIIDAGFMKINSDADVKDDDEKNIMGVMLQEYLFNRFGDGIGADDLISAGILNYVNPTVIRKLKALEERGLIYKSKGRPLKYKMAIDYLERD